MKTYKAVIGPIDDMPSDDYDSILLRMELTFTVGPQSLKTPYLIIEGFLNDNFLGDYMELTSLEEVKDGK